LLPNPPARTATRLRFSPALLTVTTSFIRVALRATTLPSSIVAWFFSMLSFRSSATDLAALVVVTQSASTSVFVPVKKLFFSSPTFLALAQPTCEQASSSVRADSTRM
jgi:hypothetical protein